MKAKNIHVGDHYKAKISGQLVTVRVDAIVQETEYPSRDLRTYYQVTNLRTGRPNEFRSAAKFRLAVPASDPSVLASCSLGRAILMACQYDGE